MNNLTFDDAEKAFLRGDIGHAIEITAQLAIASSPLVLYPGGNRCVANAIVSSQDHSRYFHEKENVTNLVIRKLVSEGVLGTANAVMFKYMFNYYCDESDWDSIPSISKHHPNLCTLSYVAMFSHQPSPLYFSSP